MSDATSVVDVKVNAEEFERFYELYQKYNDQLGKMPPEWKASADTTRTMAGSFDQITAAMLAQNALIREQTQSSQSKRDFDKSIADERLSAAKEAAKIERERQLQDEDHQKRTKQFWSDSATLTGNIARNTVSFTKDMAEFGFKAMGALAIGGGFGLFGLDALAGAVSGQRRSAQGLGITTGENQAFGINFASRLVGSDFLGAVQAMKTDITKQGMFAQIGIPESEVQTADTAQLGIDVIKRANALWRANPGLHTQQGLQQFGLQGFMDYATWQRIGQSTPDQLQGYENQYQKDQSSLTQNPQTLNDWQNFSVQLTRAGNEIEAVFVKGLDPLIPSLTSLSQAVSTALGGFLSNPHLKEWLVDAGQGIEAFSKYLGSDKFQRDVKTFSDDVSYAAGQMVGALKWLGLIPSTASPGSPGGPPAPIWHSDNPALPQVGGTPLFPGAPSWLQSRNGYSFDKIAKFYNLPASLFSAVAQQESGTNAHPTDSVVNGQHYQGMFQMGSAMQQQFGVTDPYNPSQEANAFGAQMFRYLKKYKGDLSKSIAAYDWGPGNVDKDISAHGSEWLKYAPNETKNYVSNVLSKVGTNSIDPSPTVKVQVSVRNQTGAQVAILANATRQ